MKERWSNHLDNQKIEFLIRCNVTLPGETPGFIIIYFFNCPLFERLICLEGASSMLSCPTSFSGHFIFRNQHR